MKTAKRNETAPLTIPPGGEICGDDYAVLGYLKPHGFLIKRPVYEENISGRWKRLSDKRTSAIVDEGRFQTLMAAGKIRRREEVKPISADDALRLIPRFFGNAGGFQSLIHAALDRAGVARA
jgi:hypothetical protein